MQNSIKFKIAIISQICIDKYIHMFKIFEMLKRTLLLSVLNNAICPFSFNQPMLFTCLCIKHMQAETRKRI